MSNDLEGRGQRWDDASSKAIRGGHHPLLACEFFQQIAIFSTKRVYSCSLFAFSINDDWVDTLYNAAAPLPLKYLDPPLDDVIPPTDM